MAAIIPKLGPVDYAVIAAYLAGFWVIFALHLGDFLFFTLFGWVIFGFVLSYRKITAHLR